jgi:hypothetical protein
MKLKNAFQQKYSEIKNEKFDVIFAASGYEKRCTQLIEKINLKGAKKIVFAFEEHVQEEQRIVNDKKFARLGFEPYSAKEGSYIEIIEILNDVLRTLLIKNQLNVLVDYSCMTKVWYATIVNYFLNKESDINNINITFSYTPSIFTEPLKPMPNKYMGPIPGIYTISASNKPTALIMGLGYEKDRAKGLMEYLDPKITLAFYTDPALDEKYVNAIKKNNSQLLSNLGKQNIFKYPLDDLRITDSLLTSLCLSLKNHYKIVLAPLGPKPFALLSILLSIKFPEIDVWRVSAGDSGNIYPSTAYLGDPIICKVFFERENLPIRFKGVILKERMPVSITPEKVFEIA